MQHSYSDPIEASWIEKDVNHSGTVWCPVWSLQSKRLNFTEEQSNVEMLEETDNLQLLHSIKNYWQKKKSISGDSAGVNDLRTMGAKNLIVTMKEDTHHFNEKKPNIVFMLSLKLE